METPFRKNLLIVSYVRISPNVSLVCRQDVLGLGCNCEVDMSRKSFIVSVYYISGDVLI
jgi:hypothetical protein